MSCAKVFLDKSIYIFKSSFGHPQFIIFLMIFGKHIVKKPGIPCQILRIKKVHEPKLLHIYISVDILYHQLQ